MTSNLENVVIPANWHFEKRFPTQGKQGETFLVRSTLANGLAVLKRPVEAHSQKGRLRLRTEALNLERLTKAKANTPALIVDATDNDGYLLMEFIDGPLLRDYVARFSKLELPIALQLFQSLLDTIQIAHSLDPPILHRDIKPTNITVRDDKLVLLDFGLSFSEEDDAEDATTFNETIGNRWFELDEYRVPGGTKRDARSDLTGICGIFYYMITGIAPRRLNDGNGLPPHRRQGMTLDSLNESASTLNNFFDSAFRFALSERFQSWGEVRNAIELFHDKYREPLDSFAETIHQRISATNRARIIRRDQNLPAFFNTLKMLARRPIPNFASEVITGSCKHFLNLLGIHAEPIYSKACVLEITASAVNITRGLCFYIEGDASETRCLVASFDGSIRNNQTVKVTPPQLLIKWFDDQATTGPLTLAIDLEIKKCLEALWIQSDTP